MKLTFVLVLILFTTATTPQDSQDSKSISTDFAKKKAKMWNHLNEIIDKAIDDVKVLDELLEMCDQCMKTFGGSKRVVKFATILIEYGLSKIIPTTGPKFTKIKNLLCYFNLKLSIMRQLENRYRRIMTMGRIKRWFLYDIKQQTQYKDFLIYKHEAALANVNFRMSKAIEESKILACAFPNVDTILEDALKQKNADHILHNFCARFEISLEACAESLLSQEEEEEIYEDESSLVTTSNVI